MSASRRVRDKSADQPGWKTESKIRRWLRVWWRGEFLMEKEDEGETFVLKFATRGPHWAAEALKAIGRFWLAHWQWIITTAVAIILGLLAIR